MSEIDEKAVVYSVKKGFLKKKIKNSYSPKNNQRPNKLTKIFIFVIILVIILIIGIILINKNRKPKNGVYNVSNGTSTFNEQDTQKLIDEQKNKVINPKNVKIPKEDDGNVR